MKSSGSLQALICIPPPNEEETSKSKQDYSREFQAMLDSFDEEDCLEEASRWQSSEKKRRLTIDQVKALEKNFEVENKLEPERKLKLAEELRLQPRQVAIWFQNRRARRKTKQLEKDYALLKASFDALKTDYTNLEQEKEALTAELRELKAKLKEEHAESSLSVKEVNFDIGTFKEESNGNAQLLTSPDSSSSLQFNGSRSSSNSSVYWVRSFDPIMVMGSSYGQAPFVKVEEQSTLFNAEHTCDFFSVDQAPTLQWYFTGK